MIDGGFACCKTVKCVERFRAGAYDGGTLRREQEALEELAHTRKGRFLFVTNHVPLSKPGRKQGSMVAAGALVCNSFFARAFGVSFNLINAATDNQGGATRYR